MGTIAQIVAFVIAVAVIVWVVRRASATRDRLDSGVEPTTKPKRLSRKERLRRQIEEENPLPERPSIVDLMMEEAAETGVEEIPGGDGIAIPVKLKVWRRDEAIRVAGPQGAVLHYRVAEGIAADTATVDDVRLVWLAADGADVTPEIASPDDAADEPGAVPPLDEDLTADD